jgi:hypothetical protein
MERFEGSDSLLHEYPVANPIQWQSSLSNLLSDVSCPVVSTYALVRVLTHHSVWRDESRTKYEVLKIRLILVRETRTRAPNADEIE